MASQVQLATQTGGQGLEAWGSARDSLRELVPLPSVSKKVPSLSSDSIATVLRRKFEDADPRGHVMVLPPPPVRGVGRAGGFKIMIEDRSSSAGSLEGLRELQKATE